MQQYWVFTPAPPAERRAKLRSADPSAAPQGNAGLRPAPWRVEARALADGSGLVFPSARGALRSQLAIAKLVRDRGIGAVPHGFRSSFRDWAAECSAAPRDVRELTVAHVNTDAIEVAYRRTDLFERRGALLEPWAAFPARTEDKGRPGRQMTGGEPHGHWRIFFCIGRAGRSAGIVAGLM